MNRREFGQVLGVELGVAILGRDILRGLTAFSFAPGEVIRKGDPDKSQVALTFDDGFLPQHIEKVLRIMETYGLKITFCPIGDRSLKKYPDLWRAADEAGHEIANHSYTHRVLRTDRLTVEEIAKDISDDQDVLDSILGRHRNVNFLRPPGGYVEPALIQIANAQGLDVVNWSVTSAGTGPLSTPDSSYENVVKAKGGDIVLMHCINNDTARLSEIVETLLGKGLEIVTLSGLLDREDIPI